MTLRGGIGLVFALIGLAVIVSFTLLALMYLSVSRGPSVPSSASLVLRPGGDLPELPPDDVVGQFFGAESDSVRTLVESLERAKDGSAHHQRAAAAGLHWTCRTGPRCRSCATR